MHQLKDQDGFRDNARELGDVVRARRGRKFNREVIVFRGSGDEELWLLRAAS